MVPYSNMAEDHIGIAIFIYKKQAARLPFEQLKLKMFLISFEV